jgi:uncharacterized damage-inducible protein DinB
MTVRDLEVTYDYNCWANGKLFDVIAQLTVEDFTRPVAGSYGSVRNTLVHVLSAEAGWLERCGGPQRGPRFNADDFPTFESVLEKWTSVEAKWRAFLAALTDDDLAAIVEFTVASSAKYAMPLGQLVQHTTTHGVHHRGQVALLLRLLGKAPGDFDILLYFAEQQGPPRD